MFRPTISGGGEGVLEDDSLAPGTAGSFDLSTVDIPPSSEAQTLVRIVFPSCGSLV